MCTLWVFYNTGTLMNFSLPANAPLLLAFSDLPDPRKQRNQHYPLIDIIAVVVMGIICAADDFVAAYRQACHHESGLNQWDYA